MDLVDQLRALSTRIPQHLAHTKTEEGTKHALVMPFIHALGYNVFDPTEVVPEFVADVGIKKGEKIDYAIMREGKPIILFECKHATANLDEVHFSQLFRYYHVTSARIGVLTNGVVYRFFTDLEEPNKMDAKPFLEFNLLDFHPPTVEEVKRFAKASFNMDEVLSAAVELKYTKAIKHILAEQMDAPSDEIVRFFAGRVYSGAKTQKVIQQFTDITRRALNQFIIDRINERLKSALGPESPTVEASRPPASQGPSSAPVGAAQPPEGATADDGKVVTTEEEREAYLIVKAIVREVVDPKRVVMRDAESYCAILLDDNNRKPICRLRFGTSKKQLGLFNPDKTEDRVAISDLNDIFQYADRLKATPGFYEKK
ncbi:MAG: type I restriction endonuclease [Fimbriimonadaceae bacterium]